jgi:hypothetical protein
MLPLGVEEKATAAILLFVCLDVENGGATKLDDRKRSIRGPTLFHELFGS